MATTKTTAKTGELFEADQPTKTKTTERGLSKREPRAAARTEREPEESIDNVLAIIERIARDPNVPIERFERMMALYERQQERIAEQAFNAAMSDAQEAMKPVHAKATNPNTQSKYATYKALDQALRPIYTKHGFALSFDTADVERAELVRVLCFVTHKGGYKRTYHLDMPADGKGPKGGDVMTKTHATGSALTYGMRYLLKMVFNVAVGVEDDDGNQAATVADDEMPEGYGAWKTALESVADDGWPELSKAWNKSNAIFRNYMARKENSFWLGLKERAEAVKKGNGKK